MNKMSIDSRTTFKDLLRKALSGLQFSHIKNRSWRTKAAVLLVFASITSGFITYAALTETPPLGDDPNLVIWLLNIDLIFLLLLASLIARRIVGVWSGRKRGIAGSHLHVRLVYIFSALVAIPTIIMTVFSAFFFHYGVQSWFSQRVQTAIHESQAVAQSYLEEHKQVIRADTLAMANDLDRQADLLLLDNAKLSKAIDTQAFFRNLSEAIIIEQNGRVLGRSSLTFALEYEKPADYALKQAQEGEVVLMTGDDADRVRALVKLENFNNAYLFVGRMLDPQVLSHLNAAEMAAADYNTLQTRYSGLQVTVTMIFVVVAFLLLLAAIWAGLLLARQLITPISALITASDRVRAGDLNSRIPEENMLEEFEYLARSFNRMTDQLQAQRKDLLEANRQVDRRRRLIETVLSGVSSGVVGVDDQGIINLANNSAAVLLNKNNSEITDTYILDVIPELQGLLEGFAKRPKKTIQNDVQITLPSSQKRNFLFTISVESLEGNKTGLIITFDDITDLQTAQRNAAWSDVARRIAHEIKNPLTPIQLSAERLKRKYLKDIKNDADQKTFSQCTDTIIKHVSDIGRMVDEFSSFARMPEPDLNPQDIIKVIGESVILAKQAHPHITFDFDRNIDIPVINCDARQIRQAVSYTLQNAVDSVCSEYSNADTQKGHISITSGIKSKHEIFIAITDNGPGFPKNEDISKLTEPYITHKEKGTGLGLAIVKKIIEDHDGEMILGAPDWLHTTQHWNNLGGACVVLEFPTYIDQNQ